MDAVGRPLVEILADLERSGSRYQVEHTSPTRDFFKVDETCMYVVRQQILADGTYLLVSAAKMRKEVCDDGL